ncbi:MAG: carbamate kinase [Lachnospiraceae bacterium]|nr:carbamate kinase [Lachnospiraceae bacterium]
MKKEKVVVALGRNAIGKTLPEQKAAVVNTAKYIADLIEEHYQIVVTHSNASQVGMIRAAMSELSRLEPEYTTAPLSVCGALSQGYIGYDLQNQIRTELLNRGIFKTVATIITQVSVDPFDRAFGKPSKVIGRYLSKEEAEAEEAKGNPVVCEEKGYRRIVASPKPVDIYEIDAIRVLSDAGQIVIACGGGGVPVLAQGTRLKGASAIIEKDMAAAKMAHLLDCETLLILTEIDKVYLNFGKENQVPLDSLSVKEAEKYIEEGQFGKDTMLPKIEASIEFVSAAPKRRAVIAELKDALAALEGKAGTIIC